MRARRHSWTALSIWLLTLAATFAAAAPPVKRARPPQFPKSVADVFFPDAREKLVGDKPELAKQVADPPMPVVES